MLNWSVSQWQSNNRKEFFDCDKNWKKKNPLKFFSYFCEYLKSIKKNTMSQRPMFEPAVQDQGGLSKFAEKSAEAPFVPIGKP